MEYDRRGKQSIERRDKSNVGRIFLTLYGDTRGYYVSVRYKICGMHGYLNATIRREHSTCMQQKERIYLPKLFYNAFSGIAWLETGHVHRQILIDMGGWVFVRLVH